MYTKCCVQEVVIAGSDKQAADGSASLLRFWLLYL